MFRLRQKHSKRVLDKPPPADADQLIRAQSLIAAILAALLAAAVFNFAWVWLAGATGRFYPWFGILQGAAIGFAVQRRGHGLDWRFPALAAAVAVIASFSGGFFIALATTVTELEAGSMRILRALTWRTWQIYFDEVINPVDFIYALVAASLAAFYARRRLLRHEEFALRTRRQETANE